MIPWLRPQALARRIYHPHWTRRRCVLCHRPIVLMRAGEKGEFVGKCDHCGAEAELYTWCEGLWQHSELTCKQ